MDNRSSSYKHPRPISGDTVDAPPYKRPTLALLDEVLSPNDIKTIVKGVFLRNTFASDLTLLASDPSDTTGLDTLATFLCKMVAEAAKYTHSEVKDQYKVPGDCLQLLTSNRDVFDTVFAAARAVAEDKPATHQAIRDLFRLQALRLPNITLSRSIGQGAPQSMLAMAAKLSWTSPYIGDFPARLLADITSHVKESYAHGHGSIGAMVQSSGTGKSRTMHEITAKVFTIPINIRQTESGDVGAAYPDPDIKLRDFLISNGDGNLRERYHCFLRAMFELVEAEFRGLAVDKGSEPAEKALRWRHHLSSDDVRKTLYGRVVILASSYEKTTAALNDGPGESTKNDALAELLLATNQSFTKLLKTVDSPESLKILMYFDEAHTLAATPADSTKYDTLCSALADIEDIHHFTIFMSTTGAQSILGRPQHEYHSSRAVAPATRLPAPFTILPFDIGPYVLHKQVTFNTLRSIEHLAGFGRPLWHTMLAAHASPASLVLLARSKLTHKNRGPHSSFPIHGGTAPAQPVGQLEEVVQMALVGIRVMIEFAPRREKARRLQEEMVKGHMRIAFSVPLHREYMRSGHPSEPILAEAAAVSIYEEGVNMMKVISDLLQNDLINKGERGELVARLLLTLAWDAAIHRLMSQNHPILWGTHEAGLAAYSRPIRLIDFLAALLPAEYLAKILKSTPDNQLGGKTFEEAFKHAYVHFTHFGRAGSSDAINSASGLAAFIRGMAFQCCSGHPVFDILIPILIVTDVDAAKPNFNVDDLTLDRFHRSGIMISVKDKENAERRNYTISAESLNFWLDDDKDVDVPYVAILMQLGIIGKTAARGAKRKADPSPVAPTTPTRPQRTAEPPQTPSTVQVKSSTVRATRQTGKPRKEHPRYSIIISGCSSTVYKIISSDDKAAYSAMLASKGMLHEHPYNDERTLVLLRKMKPFWNLGPACFDWVDITGVGVVPDIVEMNFIPGLTYGNEAVIIEGDDDAPDDENKTDADLSHDA
ncbi:hypothetical protein EDD85DRAFT_849935 [Armillaria nabsnona]|nr:hypothetical protein EDD85DRAFT_849935 [Armillaria nabsnona]